MPGRLTRRELLGRAAQVAGAGLGATVLPRGVLEALAAPPACGRLQDIEHVVILIQENRSFDHYFGAYRGVRGFDDPTALVQPDGFSVFAQPGWRTGGPPAPGHLLPFHLDTATTKAECTNDISHAWVLQHESWNGGSMDRFLEAHLADDPSNGPLTMGYYNRADLAFYYALADAFTLCDGYFCSVIGPTDPNRLYSMSASLGADGSHGGPILTTSSSRVSRFGTLTWTTYPERLQQHGVTWKVYGTPDGDFGDNVLPYFKAYVDGSNPTLTLNGLAPSFPASFVADVAAGTLPQVSWVLASLIQSEHPPAPPHGGESVVSQVLTVLAARPDLWSRTALFITYDENGGFFDHVPPPVPPAGTAGEFLTVRPLPAEAGGIAGPIGLGFRVPLFVVSPFSRGGLVCSETFDHTSLLRFLETRFGVEVPNLSAWRRSVTGDLTAAFNFAARPDTTVPALPLAPPVDQVTLTECVPQGIVSEASNGKPSPLVPVYPVPPNSIPTQEPGTAPAPSGLGRCPSPAGAHGRGDGAVEAADASPPVVVGLPLTAGASAGASAVAAAALVGIGWTVRRRAAAARREPEG